MAIAIKEKLYSDRIATLKLLVELMENQPATIGGIGALREAIEPLRDCLEAHRVLNIDHLLRMKGV